MANPIYQAMQPAGPRQGGPVSMLQQFPQFMQQMRGKDPGQITQQLLSSGRLSQAQLDQAQKMAHQLEGQLNGFRSMFGF